MSSWNLKFNYNGIFRRISQTTLGYAVVEDAARKLYSIPKSHRVMLTWIDDENDLIIVSSEAEFEECIRAKTLSAGSPQQLRNTIVKFGVIVEENINNTVPIQNRNVGLNNNFQNNNNTTQPNVSHTTNSNSNNSNVVHQYFTCDGCGVSPIVGDRYRCTVRNNFDLCSACESATTPPFPMVKLYTPDLQFKVVGNWEGIDGGKLFRVNPFGFLHETGDSNIHRGVTCDGCGGKPITGVRYKCTVRDNFDLCSTCEAKTIQPHPMIKMYNSSISVNFKSECGRKPGMFNFNGFNRHGHGHGHRFGGRGCRGPVNNPTESDWPRQCPIQEAINVAAEVATVIANDVDEQILQEVLNMSFDEAQKSNENKDNEVNEANIQIPTENVKTQEDIVSNTVINVEEKSTNNNSIVRGYASKPMARFVTDITIPDATVLNPNINFMKIWLVRNDGPCDWPENVTLVPAGGDMMCDNNVTAPVESITVGQETHVAIALKTPSAPGRYVSYFRLQSSDNVVFGQKLWVDIRVQAKPGTTGWYAVPAFNNPQPTTVNTTVSTSIQTNDTFGNVSTSIQTNDTFGNEEKEDLDGNIWRFDDVTCDIINISSSPTMSQNLSLSVPLDNLIAPEVVNPIMSDEDKLWLEEREELEKEWSIELDALRQMGFTDTREIIGLLKKHVKFSFNKFPHLQGKPFSDSLSLVVDTLCN